MTTSPLQRRLPASRQAWPTMAWQGWPSLRRRGEELDVANTVPQHLGVDLGQTDAAGLMVVRGAHEQALPLAHAHLDGDVADGLVPGDELLVGWAALEMVLGSVIATQDEVQHESCQQPSALEGDRHVAAAPLHQLIQVTTRKVKVEEFEGAVQLSEAPSLLALQLAARVRTRRERRVVHEDVEVVKREALANGINARGDEGGLGERRVSKGLAGGGGGGGGEAG